MTSAFLPRRDFLKLSAAAGLIFGAPAMLARARQPRPPAPPPASHAESPPARNVIFMVADGMSAGTFELGDLLSRIKRSRPLHWVELWGRPGVRRATCSTHPANGWVTDSAAASSAWSLGERVNNGSISITPDGRTPDPVLVRARAAGKATGLVTTTRITHATPAGFIANISDRDLEKEIGQQLLERRVDVALGGGAAYFTPQSLGARDDLKVLRTRDQLLAHSDGSPVLGLFSDTHMHFDLDRAPTEPTLAEMAGAALRLLSARPNGFILQIEGGRVDQAAHANDAASLVTDMLAFDDAVAVAADFASARPDTLLVITTDHGCANPGLTFYAREGVKSFDRLTGAKHSFEWIQSEAKAIVDHSERIRQLPEIVEHATGIALSADESAILAKSLKGDHVNPFQIANGFGPVLGSLLANHTGVAFLSPNHTSDYVEVTAMGPGSERLPPMIENIWLHSLLAASLAVK